MYAKVIKKIKRNVKLLLTDRFYNNKKVANTIFLLLELTFNYFIINYSLLITFATQKNNKWL